MSIYCPECDSSVPMPDDLVATGVPKVRCRACGARFQVLPGGSTLLLEGDAGQSEVTYQPSTPSGEAGSSGSDAGSFGSDSSGHRQPAASPDADGPNLTVADPSLVASLAKGGAAEFMDYPRLEINALFRDKWRIEEEIGKGATSVVYRAHDVDTEMDVALKVVGIVGEGASHLRKAWAEEFKVRRRVTDGSHLLHLESPVTETRDGVTYVALPQELGERSLRDWMNATAGDRVGRRDQALEFFRQACRGVQALHRADLAHLDLKPENLLLVREGTQSDSSERIKLGDFGLARNLASLDAGDAGNRRFGLGTPTYMAPEQIRSARFKDIGKPADIYALGVILHELIDGAPPFQGRPDEVRDKHLEMVPERPEDIPEEYWEIIERCLEKKPRQRLQTPEDLEEMLDAAPARGEVIRKEKAEAERQSRERRHEDHWRQANELRDAEPDRALEHVKAILNDPPVALEDRVRELRKDLETLNRKVEPALNRARKVELDQSVEAALEAWSDVLALVPRNTEAKSRLDALRSGKDECEQTFGKVFDLAELGEFDQALEGVARCLEIDPNRNDIREANEPLRKRQKAYVKAMNEASRHLESTRPDLAIKAADKALVEAPRSEAARAIKETAEEQLQEFQELEIRSGKALSSAMFDEARECLDAMRELIDPSERVEALQSRLEKTESAYAGALGEAKNRAEAGDLAKVKEYAGQALDACADAKAPKELTMNADRSIRAANEKLSQAKRIMDGLKEYSERDLRSRFNEAGTWLEKARAIWPMGDAVEKEHMEFLELTYRFEGAISATKKAIADGDLVEAKKIFMEIKRVWPADSELLDLELEIMSLIEEQNEERLHETRKMELVEAGLWGFGAVMISALLFHFLFGFFRDRPGSLFFSISIGLFSLAGLVAGIWVSIKQRIDAVSFQTIGSFRVSGAIDDEENIQDEINENQSLRMASRLLGIALIVSMAVFIATPGTIEGGFSLADSLWLSALFLTIVAMISGNIIKGDSSEDGFAIRAISVFCGLVFLVLLALISFFLTEGIYGFGVLLVTVTLAAAYIPLNTAASIFVLSLFLLVCFLVS